MALNRGISTATNKGFNEKIAALCKQILFIYVDKVNLLNSHLFSDCLDLLETGKCQLANNFISAINNFLYMDTHQNKKPK